MRWDETTQWALNKIYACFDDAKRMRAAEAKHLEEPTPKQPENQSKACFDGDHEDCDWDLPAACMCECH